MRFLRNRVIVYGLIITWLSTEVAFFLGILNY